MLWESLPKPLIDLVQHPQNYYAHLVNEEEMGPFQVILQLAKSLAGKLLDIGETPYPDRQQRMDCDSSHLERRLPGEGDQFDRRSHMWILLFPKAFLRQLPHSGFNGPYEETLADAG